MYVDLGHDPLTGKRLRPHRRGFKSQKEAEMWSAHKQVEFEKSGFWSSEGLTFKTLCQRWLDFEYRNQVKESTYAKTVDIFRLHILPYLGRQQVEKLSVNFCQSVVNKWFDEGFKQYRRFRTYVINVFDFGIRMELIVRNPMSKTSIPKNKNAVEIHFDEYYEKPELTKFLACAKANGNQESFMFFRLLAYTGMRKGEALALDFADINFENRELSINKTLSQGVNGRLVIQTPKTKTSVRVISLDEETLRLLSEWQEYVTMKFDVLGYKCTTGHQLIFPNEKNSLAQPSVPDHWNRSICDNFKLHRIKIHAFRHTFCSLCAEAGIDLPSVSKMLGHADLRITTEVYLHATRHKRKQAVDAFANFMDIS
ncbi:prophage lp4 protein 1, integrase [Paucilactobacillus vaccinostercus DSM 20634]|uniref:Prophage lp4 protein 1, integrase n=1 Tax=Paucilactobacillus vaccinostercus DSM 20634 TaxID=1423813 RepID=A0A0R2A3F0_9LACO|nr:prophage lp4 protein 1, integrase [Paucilactobacillus vaccinostercus DSM 20634]